VAGGRDGSRMAPPLERPEGPATAAGDPLADRYARHIGLAAPRPVRRGARPRDEPRPVGAEGDGVGGDARVQAEALAVTEPLDVVPLPAAALGRAAVEQVLGQRDVIVLNLAKGPVDPVDVILAGQRLGVVAG